MKSTFFVWVLIIAACSMRGQSVAITIDDVPNTVKYQKDGFRSELLEKLDSLNIPVAIFINEGFLYKNKFKKQNVDLLNDWISKDYITAANHTYSHCRYSEVKLDSFKTDVEQGEFYSREICKQHNKPLKYFRFPYNDMGIDSLEHTSVYAYLQQRGYTIAPFTIESSDWMFNYVYEYYSKKGDADSAQQIGELYVERTLAYFSFFDSLSLEQYNRPIHQIYLCHDNAINARFLSKIIAALKARNYSFISLEKAMKDPVYSQQSAYYKKWGVSWFYRWMDIQKDRVNVMRKEPSNLYAEQLFQRLKKRR